MARKKKDFEDDYTEPEADPVPDMFEPASALIDDIERYVYDAGCDHVITFGGAYEGGIQHQQVPDEIAPCLAAIIESGLDVKNYLEIGVAAGGTTVIMNRFLQPELIVLVDDNKHPKQHVRHYILDGHSVTADKRIEHIGNSQNPGMLAAVSKDAESFDVIMIDGDHTYPGCRADVEQYGDLLSVGGFLILHDTALPEWGVIEVCRELKDDSRFELVGEYHSKKINKPLGVALFRKV